MNDAQAEQGRIAHLAFEQACSYVDFFEAMNIASGGGMDKQMLESMRAERIILDSVRTELETAAGEVLISREAMRAGLIISSTVRGMLNSPVRHMLVDLGIKPDSVQFTERTFRHMIDLLGAPTKGGMNA